MTSNRKVQLDPYMRNSALEQMLGHHFKPNMIAHVIDNDVEIDKVLDWVVVYRHLYSSSGSIIPVLPIATLFNSGPVVEPRQIREYCTILFETESERDNFVKWTEKIGARKSLLPGPEINADADPVYVTDYHLSKNSEMAYPDCLFLTESDLNNLSWLEQHCPDQWYYNNDMLFFFHRNHAMQWKLRYNDSEAV